MVYRVNIRNMQTHILYDIKLPEQALLYLILAFHSICTLLLKVLSLIVSLLAIIVLL